MANTPSRRGARGKLLALDDLKYSTHTQSGGYAYTHIYIYISHIYIYIDAHGSPRTQTVRPHENW